MRLALALFSCLLLVLPATAQQTADSGFDLSVARPAWPAGEGPRLVIDAGHGNFHTAEGRFAPFAGLLRNDGFVVEGRDGPITASSLEGVDILVIANPLHAGNVGGANWRLPNPSAFTSEEIAVLKAWVSGGGSLLLIADHMPFAGAAQDLAGAFGFSFSNGFVMREAGQGPDIFGRMNGGLRADVVTDGRSAEERIGRLRTFTGSAFTAPAGARPLIVLPKGYVSKEPRVAWQFDTDSRTLPAAGMLQGAVMVYGQGRLAVFGEAAMFTAQLAGEDRRPIGFNAPGAPDNRQMVLNVARWLGGLLPA